MTAHHASRTVLALRHVHFEDLGVWEPVLIARGYDVRYIDVGVDTIDEAAGDDADLLIVLGGPVGVYDVDRYPFLESTRGVIARRIRAGLPTLGICLGAQLIAEAMGAQVRSTGAVEIGYAPLQLTAAGRTSVLRELDATPVLHWHGDEFEIPKGALRLAHTSGFPNQAFSTTNVLALQFHLETDHRFIERWLIGHAHELQHHGIDPDTIRSDARLHGPRMEKIAAGVLEAWLDGLRDRVVHLDKWRGFQSYFGPRGA
ncbi:glutamine amidotransferase [Microbacterium sp. 3J1]|uniref:glutamine amidotransferase n=1 Tax=Microbacterium sp. 3J1 TaxID=861269 RepID=UPI000AE83CBE|nr:glutamine amidotransferase [Microbacterium sp. 3J1]